MNQDTKIIDNLAQMTENREEFLVRAKVIFKVFDEKLETIGLSVRAITTLATLQDIKSYPESSSEEIISRAYLYADALLIKKDLILSMPSNEEKLFACMTLFSLENRNEDDEELLRDQDQEIEELIEDFVVKEIERVIWSSADPSLLENLVKEMKRILSKDRKENLGYLLANIAQLQKELHKAASQLKGQAKKISIDLFKKRMAHMLTSFIKELEKQLQLNRNKQKNITKTRKIRNCLMSFMKRKQMFKRTVTKAAKRLKRVSGRQELFDLLTCHQPIKQLKLKMILGGDHNIIKEVKGLVQTGMSIKEASGHLIKKHDLSPNKTTFQESLSSRGKEKSKNLAPAF